MSEITGRFWMVHGIGQSSPTVRHQTENRALEEAKRLASRNPGIEFYVLAAIARAVKVDVEVRRIDDDDEMPF